MRRLGGWLTFLGVLVVLAGGYRAGVAASVKSAITSVPGLTAEDVAVQGFPTRFDVTLTEPAFQSAAGGLQAPSLTITAPVYWPFAADARVSPQTDLRLDAGAGQFTVRDAAMSFGVRPGADLQVTRWGVSGVAVQWQAAPIFALSPSSGAGQSMAQSGPFDLMVRSVGGGDYAVQASIADLVMDLAELGGVVRPDDAPLTGRLDTAFARFDGLVQFDAPVSALAQALPPLRGMSAVTILAIWQESEISVQGALEIDAAGAVSGAFDVQITGWQYVLDQARRMNLWDARTHTMLALAAVTFAADSPDGAILRAPITITAGVVRVGPLVIGQVQPVY